MDPKERREHFVMLSFADGEMKQIQDEMKNAGFEKPAIYLRKKLVAREDRLIYNPREALDALGVIGKEVGAIGKNINQLARYANYLKLNGMMKPEVMEEYNAQLRKLTEIELQMQKVVRGFFREGKKKYL